MTTRRIGRDGTGTLATDGDIVFYLTDCCGASAKGSVNSPTGVCCRGCYAPIDPRLGAGWTIIDFLRKVNA